VVRSEITFITGTQSMPKSTTTPVAIRPTRTSFRSDWPGFSFS
jgi:hypothetical protein